MTCKECNGTGLYVGLNETSECRACAQEDVQISMDIWVDGEPWVGKEKEILEAFKQIFDKEDETSEWEPLGYLLIRR